LNKNNIKWLVSTSVRLKKDKCGRLKVPHSSWQHVVSVNLKKLIQECHRTLNEQQIHIVTQSTLRNKTETCDIKYLCCGLQIFLTEFKLISDIVTAPL
jgi:hypothetical protein